MDEDDDVFLDTISVHSHTSSRPRTNRNDYMSLSRNTIYHSAENIELTMADGNNPTSIVEDSPRHKTDKVSGHKIVTYSQWKDRCWNKFQDGVTTVDFVLAYESIDHVHHMKKREIYERNLESKGLVLEKEEKLKFHFVKIHVPENVLSQYCEILKMRMPIKNIPGQEETDNEYSFDIISGVRSIIDKILNYLNVPLDPNLFPDKKYELTAEFSRDKSYLFNTTEGEFFSVSTKNTIVNFILEREKFNNQPEAVYDVGIVKLLSEGVYSAAYPLHDGSTKKPGSERSLLLTEWASVNKWIKFQPKDKIKDYFGIKIALYFTWLGFYTNMLIPASIVGLLCIFYGLITLPYDSLSNDICDPNLNFTMCPQCDKYCDYWNLIDACTYSKLTHLFDNNFTVLFAIFMSIWSALYLEMWKRHSAEITHRWGLTNFDIQAEHPRPQYLARLVNAKKYRYNPVMNIKEPVPPFWRVKLPAMILSFSFALLWVLLALVAVLGVIVYRMSRVTSDVLFTDKSNSYRTLIIPCVASLINLVCIIILNFVYSYLAVWLTEREYQRTQLEYDDSLTLKIYMFQFVNYYSSIFYIAFLKGKFVGYPSKYNRVFGFRQEECSPGGCLMELCIQLGIIMIGNQAMNSILEILIPFLKKLYNSFKIKTGIIKENKGDDIICFNQWTEDYKLLGWNNQSLFAEYLEMVMQYGFITIFVTAFPLAPLLALINNVFEMRLDAKKFLKYYRRPVPERVKSIGIWFHIIEAIGRISLVSNAFIIAFSSNFIPMLVYKLRVSANGSEEGFLNHSLAYFNTKDFQYGSPIESVYNVTQCRYPEYRNSPWEMPDEEKYKRPTIYWHIIAARLAFVVVYQNVVTLIIMIIQWAIPDIPKKLKCQIKQELLRTSDLIIKNEMLNAKKKCEEDEHKSDLQNGENAYSNLVFRQNAESGDHMENSLYPTIH